MLLEDLPSNFISIRKRFGLIFEMILALFTQFILPLSFVFHRTLVLCIFLLYHSLLQSILGRLRRQWLMFFVIDPARSILLCSCYGPEFNPQAHSRLWVPVDIALKHCPGQIVSVSGGAIFYRRRLRIGIALKINARLEATVYLRRTMLLKASAAVRVKSTLAATLRSPTTMPLRRHTID